MPSQNSLVVPLCYAIKQRSMSPGLPSLIEIAMSDDVDMSSRKSTSNSIFTECATLLFAIAQARASPSTLSSSVILRAGSNKATVSEILSSKSRGSSKSLPGPLLNRWIRLRIKQQSVNDMFRFFPIFYQPTYFFISKSLPLY